MTKKVTTAKKTVAKKATASKPEVKVTLTVNDYEVPMLAIENMKPRNVYISVKKACAILATRENPELMTSVEAYGRDLNRVDYGDGKGFKVGDTKLQAVLKHAKAIEKAIA